MTTRCGTYKLPELSENDLQQVSDFRRFLALEESDHDGRTLLPDWRWMEYVRGSMGAPPLLFEGDGA